ncbi:MAG: diguanylate cyclase [Idiomarina sp.]|nr:diguanylate cyclase [Idiomarina sp.]
MNRSCCDSKMKTKPSGTSRRVLFGALLALCVLLPSVPFSLVHASAVMQQEHSTPSPKSLGDFNKPLIQYAMSHWNTRDGLPHNSVNNITQTPDGYLWLATWEGPVRFNGRSFDVFDDIEALGLPETGVMGITHNPTNNHIYISGPRGGIARFDGELWHPLSAAPGFVFRVAVDHEGHLWAAAEGHGVVRYDTNGNMRQYGVAEGLSSDFAYRVYAMPAQGERDNEVLVGTSNGLSRYNQETDEFEQVSLLLDGQVRDVLQHSSGMLLVASDNGLFFQNEPEQSFQPWPVAIEGTITALEEGAEGALWYGTLTHGVGRLSNRGVSTLGVEQGLPNPHVLDIFRDHEENMWISTHGGLVQLRDALFTSFTRTQGLIGDYVRAITLDNNHRVWVGTSEGLSVFESSAERLFTDIVKDVSVLSLTHDTQNNDDVIYVGAYTAGVLQITNGEITARLGRDEGSSLAEIRALLKLPNSDLLVAGSPLGLFVLRVSPGAIELVRHLDVSDGLINPTVTGLTLAPNGDIWVASTGGISRVYLNGNTTAFEEWQAEAVHIERVSPAQNTFTMKNNGDYTWFGTDRGVLIFAESEYLLARDKNLSATHYWRVLNRNAGLPFDKYFSLTFDFDQNLWLGGSRGVTRVTANSLQAWLAGESNLLQSNHYVETDGMASSQVNTGGPSSALDADGHIWFATAAGVTVIAPEDINQHGVQSPPAVIERAVADSMRLAPNSRLPASTERFEFHYVGLGYRMARHIQYQVRLIGFDDDWIERGNAASAEYTSLPPGDFTFAVRSRYPGGSWSEPATISFSKAPNIYQTWWFWTLLVLAVVAAVWLRVRTLELSRVKLQRLVSEKTAELEALANEDSLTQVGNRRAFDERLFAEIKRAVRTNKRLSVAMLDLDHFKQINDRHMHEVGDQVLQIVAGVIKRTVREVDFVARWGGEEFVILFPEIDCRKAAEVSERVRAAIAAIDFSAIANDLQVTASIGVAEINQQFNHQTLLQQADQALYAAKAAGRNKVVCEEQLTD